jgi:5'-phosphate synthase pdxT subunit
MKIGIIALQGGFIEHRRILNGMGVKTIEIRKKAHLEKPFNGLILPGGESTVMSKLLKDLDLFSSLQMRIRQGLPTFGTCAGLLLLARQIDGYASPHFGVMDICARRNAYGRQLGSFYSQAGFKGVGTVPVTFIRAPYIESVGPNVEVLATLDDHIIAARENNMLVTAFHPELNDDPRVHQYFVENFLLTQ